MLNLVLLDCPPPIRHPKFTPMIQEVQKEILCSFHNILFFIIKKIPPPLKTYFTIRIFTMCYNSVNNTTRYTG